MIITLLLNTCNSRQITKNQKLKKAYRTTIKIGEINWEERNIKKLAGLNGNPKQFASHLKDVRITLQGYFSNAITSKQWVEHFSNRLNLENEEKRKHF